LNTHVQYDFKTKDLPWQALFIWLAAYYLRIVYISSMNKILLVTCLLFPSLLDAQVIDWSNFSEERMSLVMFEEMNKYVKSLSRLDSVRVNLENPDSKFRSRNWCDLYKTDKELIFEGAKWRTGDSLILSAVIQDQIMSRNYNLIRNNHTLDLHSLHNMEWKIPGMGNDLNDTLRTKIIEENANPKLLQGKWMADFKCYGLLCYTEILESVCYRGYETGHTYQDVAIHFIDGWNLSPPHAALMNANYNNKVIVGVTTYFHKETKTIFISFVFVS